MRFTFTKNNMIRGAVIYAIGDSIAALITDDFSLQRLLGIIFLGGIVYAFEIPNLLGWIKENFYDKEVKHGKIYSTLIFSIYFNPLWIARHLLILNLFEGNFGEINMNLLSIGIDSFIYSTPVALPANYIITNVISYKWRFTVSAIFSGMMALYYALSETWFK